LIQDYSGNVWTLVGGDIYVNGIKDNKSSNVVELFWHDHGSWAGSYGTQGEITQKNTQGQYFKWTGAIWTLCVDPRMGGTSADGTTLDGTTGSYIIDKSCNTWTLSNGYIYRTGPGDKDATKDSYAINVNLLLWYGGMLYHRNTTGQYYVLPFNTNGPSLPCTDPRVALAANTGSFYGLNGHYDYPNPPFSPENTVAVLKDLGITIYRTNVDDISRTLPPVVDLAKALHSAGLKLFPVMDYGLYQFRNFTTSILFPDEESAYNAYKSDAAKIATALQPYGVDTYECGNELTRDGNIILNEGYAGNFPGDFNNKNWLIMKGLIRGMIDGIKSVQPNARCAVNFCVANTAAADMLWDGTQPDGTNGHPKVRWDVTTWHNYKPYGDIFNIGTDGAGPGFNLPVYTKACYGVPFMTTEWNAVVNLTVDPHFTEKQRAAYIQQQLTELYSARKTNAIESTMLYELAGGDYFGFWGIVYGNLTGVQPTYNTYQAFVKQHPDV
jgi:hypothetical protein